MALTSRGFSGRRRAERSDGCRPGQYVERRLPGAVGRADAARRRSTTWTLHDRRAQVDQPATLDVGGVPGAAARDVTVDIHCVTKWSKFDTHWAGVSVDTLLDGVETRGRVRHGVLRRRLHDQPAARGRHRRQGVGRVRATTATPLEPEHGGPARLLVPHLYFWKSAKWVRGLRADATTTSPASGRRSATTTTATRGASSATRATDAGRRAAVAGRCARRDAARRRRSSLDVPGWPGHRAGQHVDVRLTRRGRLHGAAQLLDRLRARGRADSS